MEKSSSYAAEIVRWATFTWTWGIRGSNNGQFVVLGSFGNGSSHAFPWIKPFVRQDAAPIQLVTSPHASGRSSSIRVHARIQLGHVAVDKVRLTSSS